MKKILLISMVAGSLIACNGKSGDADGQSTPKGVAEMVFSAARSGDHSKLKDLCNASLDTDSDSKNVCEVSTTTDEKMKAAFKEYFSKGKVVGEPTITGDNAEVKVLFGPDGTSEETFKMTKKDGKWYLVSF